MKTMKKFLVVLVLLLLVSSVTVVAVLASDPTPGNLNVAGQYMSNINSATNPTDKMAAIVAYDEYMESHTFPTDPVSELNYNIIVESATAAKLAFTKENIETIRSNAGYLAADDLESIKNANVAAANYKNLLGSFETLYFLKDSEEYLSFAKEYEAKMAKIKEVYDARIAENYTAGFGEYEYPVAQNFDFEASDTGVVTQLTHKNFEKTTEETFAYEYKQVFGGGASGSMGYYYEKTTARSGDPYTTISNLSAGSYPGFVLEFDYYHVPGAKLQLSRGSIDINGNKSQTTEYGTFTTESYTPGSSQFSSKYSKVTPEGGVLVENSWNRIAIALNAETGVFNAYVNYQFVAEFMWTKPGEPAGFEPAQVRFKYQGNEMRLDNVMVYYGTQPRILDRFETMADDERFLMYSEVISDTSESFENRDGAYEWMSQNVGFFYDEFNEEYAYGISEQLKAAVDKYLAFDYAEMKLVDHVTGANNEQYNFETRLAYYDDAADYIGILGYIKYELVDDVNVAVPNIDKIGSHRTAVIAAVESFIQIDRNAIWNGYLDANMEGLKAIYNELLAIDDTTFDTITSRNSAIAKYETYISTVTTEKLPQGKELADMTIAVERAKAKVAFDLAVESVKNALSSFNNAPTYEAQRKWADRIEGLLYVDGVYIFADMTLLVELEGMKSDYDSMADKIAEKTNENNSKKVVVGVRTYKEYILNIFNEEIKAQTPVGELPSLVKISEITSDMVLDYILEEKAAAEAVEDGAAPAWDYVRNYSSLAARAEKEGYDESYDGVLEAIEFNREIYAYFYDLLQEEHVAHLTETLSRYESAQTYVDKLGICTYIDNYIAAQDIDTSREAIVALIARVAEIRASLNSENGVPSDAEVEYLEALKANTSLFIAAVDGMVAARDQGYTALYEAWQKAVKYYYFMEITSDDVKAAIAEYTVLESQLFDWQENCDLFIEAVNVWNTETDLTKDQTYSALATAYAFKEFTNSTYPGMAEALRTYEAAYTAYNAPIQTVNGEVMETTNFVFAAREPYSALDAIAKFFEKLFA